MSETPEGEVFDTELEPDEPAEQAEASEAQDDLVDDGED